MSYPVSGMVKGRGYNQVGYPNAPEMIPHGFSVILNAPAVFRFTAGACPARHLEAAAALGVDTSNANLADAGKILADRLVEIMDRLKVPSGLKALGYSSSDIPALVEGTLPQHRVTKLSPRPATTDDLAKLFEETLQVF
jgi:hydroxyacid-oxoacid transhydrogenase